VVEEIKWYQVGVNQRVKLGQRCGENVGAKGDLTQVAVIKVFQVLWLIQQADHHPKGVLRKRGVSKTGER